jgi:heme/copper-type cytochrome/quinol oxidase subunit 3
MGTGHAAVMGRMDEPQRYIRPTVVASGVLGMLVFIAVELMFFGALISARFIVSANVGEWPPAGQPRLPVLTTALNTGILLASGVALFLANRAFANSESHVRTRRWLAAAIVLGVAFVGFQGVEWVRLLGYGLTMQSSPYGSFFYLLIGAHAVHAGAALGLLLHVQRAFGRGQLRVERFWAAQAFWYFVVGLWPVLYVTVYLM